MLQVHRQAWSKPDAQTKRARQCPHRKTSTPSHELACDQKTDRESPCRAARISPATIRPRMPKEYVPRQASSSRRCWRETEVQLELNDDHARDVEGKQLVRLRECRR